MKNYFIKFLTAYDYNSFQEFLLSLFPSFKYQLQTLMFIISGISGAVSFVFGITPALAIAMFVAVLSEVITGIKASKKLGRRFESFRFSRCILKIGIWLIILFVIHAFEDEFEAKTSLIEAAAYYFFQFTYVAILTGFLVEYITSILENISVLHGRDKTEIINAISGGWRNLIARIKPKSNQNED